MDLRERTNNKYRHPWELSRTRNLIRICREVMPQKQLIKIADIGAGDRYFDSRLLECLLKDDIDTIIYAVDNQYDNIFSEQKGLVLHKDFSVLENDSMDCVIMMDVLEHVQEDDAFLGSILEKLKANGILIVTVPAFQSLFSSHDTYLKHYRRYNIRGLHKLLQSNNMQVLQSYYFYFSLFIIRWLQVKFKKKKRIEDNVGIGMWRYGEKSRVTKSIDFLLNVDFSISSIANKLGIRLPGLSLLAIAVKKGHANDIVEVIHMGDRNEKIFVKIGPIRL